jgi:hypothetical protein
LSVGHLEGSIEFLGQSIQIFLQDARLDDGLVDFFFLFVRIRDDLENLFGEERTRMIVLRDRRFVLFVVTLKISELFVFVFDVIQKNASFGFHLVDLSEFLVQFRLTIVQRLKQLIASFV